MTQESLPFSSGARETHMVQSAGSWFTALTLRRNLVSKELSLCATRRGGWHQTLLNQRARIGSSCGGTFLTCRRPGHVGNVPPQSRCCRIMHGYLGFLAFLFEIDHPWG